MIKKIYLVFAVCMLIIGCTKDEDDCICEKWIITGVQSAYMFGDVDMGYCTGEIENPTPQIAHYKKECN